MATHPEEHLLIFEPNHAGRAVDLLLRQHIGKPRIEAFVCALAAGAQCQENVLWAVLIGATTVQGAEGVNLDRWGRFIGEHRGGLVNNDYREFIDLRVTVNSAIPSEDALYSVIADAVNPQTVTVYDLLPHGRQYVVLSQAFVPDAIRTHTSGLVRDFRPAGVITPVVETVPQAMEIEWLTPAITGTTITSGTGEAVVARLIYSGRGPG